MNDIAKFRECNLTDEELLEAIDKQTDTMFQTRKVPAIHIPARPNSDYDLLVGELILRYHEKVLNLSEKNTNEAIRKKSK